MPALFVMFSPSPPARISARLATKMSVSLVGAPTSLSRGVPAPDAEAWYAISLLSGDQVAELPWVKNCCWVPSVFIRYRSERLTHVAQWLKRVLSKTILSPSGDRAGKRSKDVLFVKRRGFVRSGFVR